MRLTSTEARRTDSSYHVAATLTEQGKSYYHGVLFYNSPLTEHHPLAHLYTNSMLGHPEPA